MHRSTPAVLQPTGLPEGDADDTDAAKKLERPKRRVCAIPGRSMLLLAVLAVLTMALGSILAWARFLQRDSQEAQWRIAAAASKVSVERNALRETQALYLLRSSIESRAAADANDESSPLHAVTGWQPLRAHWQPDARRWRLEDGAYTIPRLLHQSWPTRGVPDALQRYVSSWKTIQPSWGYRLHTDADNAALVAEQYPWLEPTFARLSHIQQADVARLLYMHAYGGVYADLDVELLQPLQPLLELIIARKGARAILSQEPAAHALLLERRPRLACNAILASEPKHPFWLWLVKRIHQRLGTADPVVDDTDPVGTTGPRMLEEALNSWEAVHGESFAKVYTAPGQTLMPLWDSMQKETFRERCSPQAEESGAWPQYANETEITMLGLAERVCECCKRLSQDGFEPTVPTDGSSFTAHHWTHTWLDGPSSRDGDGEVVLDTPEHPAGSSLRDDGTQRGDSTRLPSGTLHALGLLDADLGRDYGTLERVPEGALGAAPGATTGLLATLHSWLGLDARRLS